MIFIINAKRLPMLTETMKHGSYIMLISMVTADIKSICYFDL